MSMLMTQPLDTSDPILMSDDERTVILTPVPRSAAFWLYDYDQAPSMNFRFSSEVRQRARQLRDAELQIAVNHVGQVAA
jgi:hypothetical protein